MTVLTEGRHAAEFLVSEANGSRSREAVTIASGQNLAAGAVLGRVNTGTAAATAFAGNTGDGVMGAITVSGAAKPGVYKLTIVAAATAAGAFQVEDPDGVVVGTGDVAAAFSAGGLAFTLADGTADFAAGDGFNIAVDISAVQYKEYDPANTDGSQIAVAVLYDSVDATDAAMKGVAIMRDAEVKAGALPWFSGATSTQKTTGADDLATAGIIVR